MTCGDTRKDVVIVFFDWLEDSTDYVSLCRIVCRLIWKPCDKGTVKLWQSLQPTCRVVPICQRGPGSSDEGHVQLEALVVGLVVADLTL